MPSLLQDAKKLFGSDDLYKVLSISKDASQSQVKKAYHKLSLTVHPDRVTDANKAKATKKFQTLGKIYSILSDKEKRALYDESGEVDDECIVDPDRDWYAYWRLLFAKITVDDIEKYAAKYQGSDEELADLKDAYKCCRGDMDDIIDSMQCATADDAQRFRDILTPLIEAKELPKYRAFTETPTKSAQRKRKAESEAAEAEEMLKEMKVKQTDGLKALIERNQKSREQQADDFFTQMEQKYCSTEKTRKGGTGGTKKTGKKK